MSTSPTLDPTTAHRAAAIAAAEAPLPAGPARYMRAAAGALVRAARAELREAGTTAATPCSPAPSWPSAAPA